MVGDRYVTGARLLTSGQLTDTYLLALAASKNGRFAILDSRVESKALPDGKAALHVIAA